MSRNSRREFIKLGVAGATAGGIHVHGLSESPMLRNLAPNAAHERYGDGFSRHPSTDS